MGTILDRHSGMIWAQTELKLCSLQVRSNKSQLLLWIKIRLSSKTPLFRRKIAIGWVTAQLEIPLTSMSSWISPKNLKKCCISSSSQMQRTLTNQRMETLIRQCSLGRCKSVTTETNSPLRRQSRIRKSLQNTNYNNSTRTIQTSALEYRHPLRQVLILEK